MRTSAVRCALLLGFGLVVSLLAPQVLAAQPGTDNSYTLSVGGYYHGTGSGTIKGHLLSISGTVQTDDGGSGPIAAKNIHLKGNTFTGPFTICGHNATLSGRFDIPAAHSNPGHIGHGRIVITFTVDDGHVGRIVGIAAD